MAWPSSLDYSGSFSMSFDNENIQTEFISGRTRLRRRGDRNNDICSISVITDDSGYSLFKAFYETEINFGELTYIGPYYVGNTKKFTALMRMVQGSYTETYLSPNRWKLSFSSTILSRSFTEEIAVYNAVIANGGFPLP